jgi:hypothetical protein
MKPKEGTTKGTKRTKMIRYGIRFTRRYGAMGKHLKHRNVYLRSLTPFSVRSKRGVWWLLSFLWLLVEGAKDSGL